jgi:hypothetical protein
MITVTKRVALMIAAMKSPPSDPVCSSTPARSRRHRLSQSSTSEALAAMNNDSSGVDRIAAPAVGMIMSTPSPLLAPPAA